MLVRFLTSIADVRGWAFDYGEMADLPDERAQEFIAQGKAELVARNCPHCGGELGLGTIEAAALGAPPERATHQPVKKRG